MPKTTTRKRKPASPKLVTIAVDPELAKRIRMCQLIDSIAARAEEEFGNSEDAKELGDAFFQAFVNVWDSASKYLINSPYLTQKGVKANG